MADFLRFSARWQKFLILLLAAATFLSLLGRRDVVTSHEARVAQTSRIMAASGWPWNAQPVQVPKVTKVLINGMTQLRPAPGNDTMPVNPWIVPVMNDQIRLQKPPLPYWCAAIAFRLFGIGEGWARLVPALLGLFATLLIYDLSEMLLGRRSGLIAAAVWLTTGHFLVDEYRKAMADPYLAFFTLTAIWAWIRFGQKRSSAFILNIFYISLGLGFLSKGPVIFLLVGFALIGYHLFHRTRLGSVASHLVGLVLFLLIAAPWFVYCLRHVPHAMDLWRYESVGEVSGENVEKARGWWMYLGYAFETSLPWTPLWIAGVVIAFVHGRRGIFSPRGRRRMVAITWYALILIFFSCLAVKKKAYLLPAMPAQTLIITDAIVVLLAFAKRRLTPSPGTPAAAEIAGWKGRGEGRDVPPKGAQLSGEHHGPHPNPLPEYRARGQEPFTGMPAVLATAQALIGIGAAARITMLLMHGKHDQLLGIICGILVILLCLFALLPILRHHAASWLRLQVIAYAALTILLLGFERANEENARSAKPFAHALAEYLPKQNLPVIVHWLPEEVSFYLPLNLPDVDDSPYALMVVDHSAKTPTESPPWFSDLMGDVRVIDSRQVPLDAPDGNGRWKLFELTMDRRQYAEAE